MKISRETTRHGLKMTQLNTLWTFLLRRNHQTTFTYRKKTQYIDLETAECESMSLFNQKWTTLPGLTSIHRKCLSYNFIQQTSLSYKIHTSSVWRKCLPSNFYTCSKKNRKKIKPFLRLFENSWKDWWQKKTALIFFSKKNVYHTISICGNCMTDIFWWQHKDFEKLLQFVFQAQIKFGTQIEFCTETSIFRKKTYFFLCA